MQVRKAAFKCAHEYIKLLMSKLRPAVFRYTFTLDNISDGKYIFGTVGDHA